MSIVSWTGNLVNNFSTSKDAKILSWCLLEWRIYKHSLVELILYMVVMGVGTCHIGWIGLIDLTFEYRLAEWDTF